MDRARVVACIQEMKQCFSPEIIRIFGEKLIESLCEYIYLYYNTSTDKPLQPSDQVSKVWLSLLRDYEYELYKCCQRAGGDMIAPPARWKNRVEQQIAEYNTDITLIKLLSLNRSYPIPSSPSSRPQEPQQAALKPQEPQQATLKPQEPQQATLKLQEPQKARSHHNHTQQARSKPQEPQQAALKPQEPQQATSPAKPKSEMMKNIEERLRRGRDLIASVDASVQKSQSAIAQSQLRKQ